MTKRTEGVPYQPRVGGHAMTIEELIEWHVAAARPVPEPDDTPILSWH